MNHAPAAAGDPRILGLRLQEARKTRSLTQQEAADALGVSRPTYIAIERGTRTVQPGELVRLAELYGRTVHDLLRRQEPVRDFVTHFRAAVSRAHQGNVPLDNAADALRRMCEDYLALEEMCRAPLARNYPAVFDVEGRDSLEAAEELAASERRRLGLGDGPVPNLRDALEADVGLRTFCLSDLPSRVAGLFLYAEQLGGCIGLNAKHPAGRRLWTLAHEYGHFLAHRYEAEVTFLHTDGRPRGRERFVDAFAASFLLPALGLRRRFRELQGAGGPITLATLITLADLYGVSVQAMLLRLEDLRLIQAGTWARLQDQGLKVEEAQALLGVERRDGDSPVPRRYQSLAVQAYESELISEGELADYLRTDREAARRVVLSLTSRSELSQEGDWMQLQLEGLVPDLSATRS